MTAVREPSVEESPARGPARGSAARRSEVGAPEVIDPRPMRGPFAIAVLVVLAGFFLALWALTDSVRNTGVVELPRLEVPQVEALDIAAARAQLEEAGFVVDVQFQPNEERPKGVVIGQKPLAGSKVEQGELVTILASDGPLGLSVPGVEGQQAIDATATLQASGLAVEAVPTTSETVRANEIIGTDPAAGARVGPGTVVKLLVSSGPAPRFVPSIIDRPIEQALADIGRAGLAVGKITRVFREDLAPGTVFEADPPVAAPVPRDTPVALKVAGPEPTVKVPYFVGLRKESAEKVARSAGVVVRVVSSPVAPGDPLDGRVIAQGTPPQAEVDEDATVEITVATAVEPIPAPTTTATPAPPAGGG